MTCAFPFREWDLVICLRMSGTWTPGAMLSMDRFHINYWKQSSTEVTESGPGPDELGYVTNSVVWLTERTMPGQKRTWGC